MKWFGFQLFKITEVEEFNRGNPFILTGYRGPLHWTDCIKSIFTLHNETLNIWTHLLGFIYFTVAFFQHMHLLTDYFWPDYLLLFIVFGSYQVTLISSASFHVFSCSSKEVLEGCLILDLLGIGLSIGATFIGGIHYGFYCLPFWHNFYIVSVGCLGILSLRIFFVKTLSHNEKTVFFVLASAYGLIPTFHWIWIHYSDIFCPLFSFRLFAMYGIALMAFIFYITKFPERFWPGGTFDVVGHSHQWWHILVFAALYFWLKTGQEISKFRLDHGCSAVTEEDIQHLRVWPFV